MSVCFRVRVISSGRGGGENEEEELSELRVSSNPESLGPVLSSSSDFRKKTSSPLSFAVCGIDLQIRY